VMSKYTQCKVEVMGFDGSVVKAPPCHVPDNFCPFEKELMNRKRSRKAFFILFYS
jgi:hypothetical protein